MLDVEEQLLDVAIAVSHAVDTHDGFHGSKEMTEEKKEKWMQDVRSTGECTPITKPTCTGRKKAFAKRAQKGDIHKDNLKKGKNPHGPG